MHGKRIITALLVGFSVAGAAIAAQEMARARLHPMNQSGAAGRLTFTDSGAGTMVEGTASGLEPSFARYVSLVYDVGSVPGGPEGCEPTNDDLSDDEMFIGIWAVGPDGTGELIQLNPAVAAIGTFDTVSIRDTEINGGFGPEAVVACGQVAVHGGKP
jgi:hypothetical protein